MVYEYRLFFFPCFFTLADEIYYNSSAKMIFADELPNISSAIPVFLIFKLHTIADEIHFNSSAKMVLADELWCISSA